MICDIYEVWKKFPDTKPHEVGYYFTLYYNTEQNNNMLKAFWWDGTKWFWRIEPNVKAFIEMTRDDYYAPCMGKAVGFPTPKLGEFD